MTGTTPYFFAMSAGSSLTVPGLLTSALRWQYLSPNWSATVPRTSSSPIVPPETRTSNVVSLSAFMDLATESTWSADTIPLSTRICKTYSSLLVIFSGHYIANARLWQGALQYLLPAIRVCQMRFDCFG